MATFSGLSNSVAPTGHSVIVWLEDTGKDNVNVVGGKAANLGELVKNGIPVPPGFVVTAEAYKRFVEETGIHDDMIKVLEEVVKTGLPQEYEEASRRFKELIMKTSIPPSIEREISRAYSRLEELAGNECTRVAVRSSATLEDMPDASFAGQQDTYLNVTCGEEVVESVKRAWASLWTARALSYRDSLGLGHEKAYMAVIVQKMVNSRSAGVMFTLHPVTGDRMKIVIESSWGLGEAVVVGRVTPDEFVVDKESLEIVEATVANKDQALLYDQDTRDNVWVDLPSSVEELEKVKGGLPSKVYELMRKHAMVRGEPSLRKEEVVELSRIAKRVEGMYGIPMDLEWAIDADLPFPKNVIILQARAETVWSKKERKIEQLQRPREEAAVLVRGIPASPGIAMGTAKVALTVEEAARLMRRGDILITKMTNPDWVPYMKLASAIITDEGGITAHAAIVARELGIPAIVGTRNAMDAIRTGTQITVDATNGVVYEGIVEAMAKPERAAGVMPALSKRELRELYPVTATKIYMNLGEPEAIDKYVDLPFDGIGLMRIEFVISSWIGYHPLYLIEQGRGEFFVEKLADAMAKVARTIYPRPVVVRFSDFKSNEYKQLRGGEKYEPDERNPMLGWRGVSRYISPEYEPAFRLEVRAIRKVREHYRLGNVWIMFPFVRTTWELDRALEIMKDEGLKRTPDFKVWVMAEVPSIVFMADEISDRIDGFSIGSNDLTQLVLGVDRDSALLAERGYFDERDPAVTRAIKTLIEIAHKNGVTASICGQAPSVYPEITEFLVGAGIDSISVNPDVVTRTRRLVASIERKLMLNKLRRLDDRKP